MGPYGVGEDGEARQEEQDRDRRRPQGARVEDPGAEAVDGQARQQAEGHDDDEQSQDRSWHH